MTCCENRDVCDLKCTHLSVEHTLAGASPAIVALSLMRCENREVCTVRCTHRHKMLSLFLSVGLRT